MQAGEGIKIPEFQKAIKAKCPFKEEEVDVSDDEDENIARDDLQKVMRAQANNGGTLGKNLASASHGKASTLNKLYLPDDAEPDPAVDTKRNKGGTVQVKDDEAKYPYVVAAHHLIPGNGSLKRSKLFKYMVKGKKVTDKESGKTWTMKTHIGYNVNGAHNGVWLPGNYAIRKTTPPKKKRWSALTVSQPEWCLNYVCAVVKKTTRQFHDTHSDYNDAVLKRLDQFFVALLAHQSSCEDCQDETKIPPPYRVKRNLYNLSAALKVMLTGAPKTWKVPYMTSNKWKNFLLATKANKTFQKAYDEANS